MKGVYSDYTVPDVEILTLFQDCVLEVHRDAHL